MTLPSAILSSRVPLTVERVLDIRRRLEAGESLRAVARLYGLAIKTVHIVKSGRTWSNVQ